MSKEQHSNSIYGDESLSEKSKKETSSESCKDVLTGIETNSEKNVDEKEDKEPSVKTNSIKSIWLNSNETGCSKSTSDEKHDKNDVTASNVYGLKKVHAGPKFNKPLVNSYVFDANGNAFISGNLTVNGNVTQHDVYVEAAGSGDSSGFSVNNRVTEYTVSKGDGIDLLYTNSTKGPITINLGTHENSSFEANRTITIKDVTLEFAPASSYNVNVVVPHHHSLHDQSRIEYYSNGCLTVGNTYALNTSGGAVTFKYFQPNIPGAAATWVIETQFLGNPRIPPHLGIMFVPASSKTRSELINLH